jgi:hypothetical protein
MKMALTACLGTGLMLALASPSFAAGITPPEYSFSIYGPGNLIKNGGQAAWSCSWNFKMESGASTGGNPPRTSSGTMTGGTAPAPSQCSVMSISPTTWTIKSSTSTGGTGVFHGLRFKQGSTTFCYTFGEVPFEVQNNGDAPSIFRFSYPQIGQCTFAAEMNTAADLNVVP